MSTVFHFGFLMASYWCKIWYTWIAGIVSTPNFNVGMNCSSQLSSLKRTAKENLGTQRDTQTTFLLRFGLIFQGLWLAVSFTGFQTHQEPRHKRPCTVIAWWCLCTSHLWKIHASELQSQGSQGSTNPVVSHFQQIIHQVDDLLNQMKRLGF